MKGLKAVCVFCGSSFGARPAYREAAQAMGRAIAQKGIQLVYGGGNVGLMGVVADAALAAGGRVIGVIPEFLVQKELAHKGLTELHIVQSMHERKAMMAMLSEGFIALPGGFGTFEEFCEILTWSQLKLHNKPHGLLNVEGYYDPLIRQFNQALSEQFISPAHRAMVLEETDPLRLLERMAEYEAPPMKKWIDSGAPEPGFSEL